MTRTAPNRTACDEMFAAAIRHFALAGACRAISRRRQTDQTSKRVLTDTADFHSRRGGIALSLITDDVDADGF